MPGLVDRLIDPASHPEHFTTLSQSTKPSAIPRNDGPPEQREFFSDW
jgi:hypothetical protein